MAAATSPKRTVGHAQRGPVIVFDATYLGRVFKASAMAPLPGSIAPLEPAKRSEKSAVLNRSVVR
jgi:hypothetical protein